MSETLRILLVEDNPADVDLIRESLPEAGPMAFQIESVSRLSEALARLEGGGIDLVLMDLGLPDSQGLETFHRLREAMPHVPMVVLTGNADEEVALSAVREGAQDYFVKGQFDGNLLVRSLRYAMERKWAEKKLRDSEERFRTLLENTPDLIARFDRQLRHVYVNPMAARAGSLTAGEYIGKTIAETGVPEPWGKRWEERFRRVLDTGQAIEVEDDFPTPSGRRYFNTQIVPELASDGSVKTLLSIARDITERKKAEERIRKLNRVYAMLSNINQAIVRIREPQALFDETCRIAVEEGGFRMAWIGLADPTSGTVLPAAHAGVADGYLEKLDIVLGDVARGRGPTGSAVSTGKHMVCNDIQNDPNMAPWREDALRNGYRSSVTFPLKVSGEVRGAFGLYAAEPGFFDDDETKLLDELAMDIGFAMEFAEGEADRKRGEEALRLSEEKFGKAFNSGPTAIFITTLEEGRFIDVNDRATTLFGYTREEILGRTAHELNMWADYSNRDVLIQNVRRGGVVRDVEGKYRRKSGEIFDALVSVDSIDIEGTKCLISTITDISDRKRAEDAIRESEARYRTLFEDAQDGMALADAETGRLVDCNQALCRLAERDKAELVGQAQSILHPPEDNVEGISKTFRQHQTQDPGQALEACLLSKSGKSIPVEIRAGRIRMNGRDYLLGIFRDVTERKQLEEKFLRAQRLESIGALASGIAHDLNNVLMPLGMGMELFGEKFTSAEDREMLQMMDASVKRGASIVKQILTFARGMKGERGQIQLRHLVRDIQGIIKETFPKTITTAVDVGDELWTVTGDATQLEQVLMNLCVNARDAMPKGGNLTIKAENCAVDEHFAAMCPGASPGPHVLLTVQDTGMGIPHDILSKIFDPFFTTKEVGKGTGLGLATAHGIVTSHGGFINVQSEVGRGAEFRVYLPAEEVGETVERVARTEVLPQGHGEVVLVVDDELAVVEIMKATLEANGYRVLTANDGAHAVAVWAEHKQEIKATVMDLRLPVMDGSAAAQALHRLNPALPVLLMTGSPAQAAELRNSDFLPLLKPFSRSELLIKLSEALGAKTSGP